MTQDQGDLATPILAAGGILIGQEANERKIALVRRRRYGGEIGLPKGKVKAKEDLVAAALREVKEETGYEVEIVEFAGTTHYHVGGRPKAVSYFIMKIKDLSERWPVDGGEIDTVEWMTPHNAVAALTHIEDRNLVSTVFGLSKELTP
jgi:8-oxo-dGTP diphosphatase